jgi:tetratricopeptide (TPR) repeat protein
MRPIVVAAVLLSGIAFTSTASAQTAAQTRAQNVALCGDPAPEKAIVGCTAIIAAGGDKSMSLFDAHFNRGLALAQKNQHGKAIADYDAAARMRPKDAALLQSRCWSKAVSGRLTQALQDCNTSLALNPKDPDTLEIRGFTYRKMRNFTRSIADYDAALELRPDAASTLFGRGVTKHDMGVFEGAKLDFTAARKLDADIDARYTLVGVHR